MPLLLAHVAHAAPQGGMVAHGNASINQGGTLTTIHQTTDRAVIDWQSFNLSAQESARFIQPRTESVTVNRVHDASASVIAGTLQANGHVVITNPNGVMFTDTARVDVGAITVSTATATDADAAAFASGAKNKLNLSVAGNAGAAIINAGNITAKDAGLVGLVAPRVENSGIIRATKGKVTLASGDTATLDLYGDGLVSIAVSDSTTQQLINQRGLVEADGGTVLITAAAGKTVANGIIKMDGVVQARSIENKNGKIILAAAGSSSGTSRVTVKGTLDASGSGATSKGGSITVTGDQVTLASASKLNASGTKGGGSIKVGGDYQGKGSTQRAQNLKMEAGATIHADATSKGNGGEVILWSDGRTEFGGLISAKGGALAGNGGFIETSGKVSLLAAGLVDTRAANGSFGQWLLDPANITLRSRSYAGGDIDQSSVITTNWLESQLTDIILIADNQLTFDMQGDTLNLTNGNSFTAYAHGNSTSAIRTLSAGGITTTSAGNILLSAASASENGNSSIFFSHRFDLIAAGAGDITLAAQNSVGYQTGSESSKVTTNGGDIIFHADIDANGLGAIRFDATGVMLKSNGGDIVLGGGLDARTGHTGSGNSNRAGILLNNTALNASGSSVGGDILLNGGINPNGTIGHGVEIKVNSSVITSHDGAIHINGIGGTATQANTSRGVAINASVIQSDRGIITLTGKSASANNTAIHLGNGTLKSMSGGVTLAGGVTSIGSTQLISAGEGTFTSGAIQAGSNNLTIEADDMVLSGELTGTGTLTLQPYTATRDMNINNGTDDGSTLHISTAELGLIQDGWSMINLGRTDSPLTGGYVRVGNSTWNDDLTVRGRRAVVAGQLTGTAGVDFTFSATDQNEVYNQGRITTQGKIIFNKLLALFSFSSTPVFSSQGGDITIDAIRGNYSGTTSLELNSAGGNIKVVNGITNGDAQLLSKKLIFNAGTGALNIGGMVDGPWSITGMANSINLDGVWGSSSMLNAVTLTSVASLTLPSIHAGNVSITATGANNRITTGAITVKPGGSLTLTADDLDINGALTGLNGELTLQTQSGAKVMNINGTVGSGGADFNLYKQDLDNIVDGWSNIIIGRTLHWVDLWFGGNATFSDNLTVRGGGNRGYRSLTLTDGASLNTTSLSAYGSITTDGGDIISSGLTRLGLTAGVYSYIRTNGGNFITATLASFTGRSAGEINTANGANPAGNITIQGALSHQGTAVANSALHTVFNAGTTGTVSFGGTIQLQGALSAIAKTILFNGEIGGTQTTNVTLQSVDSIQLPSIAAKSLLAQSTAGDIEATGLLNLTGTGNALILVGRNISGVTDDDLQTDNGRWLIYADTVSGSADAFALDADFRRYSCTYGGTCPTMPAAGNGVLFKETPILSVKAVASDVVYGSAVDMSNYGYAVTGYYADDATRDSRTGTLTFSTDYAQGDNVGKYAVNYANGALLSAMGYAFSYLDNAEAVNVTPRVLTASLTGAVTKTYDGALAANVGLSNFSLSNNIYGSDTVVIDLASAAANYASSNAGSGIAVAVNGLGLTGAHAGNYVLSSSAVSAAIGEIGRALLTVVADAKSKVYGELNPLLTYSYSGLVGNDTAASFTGSLSRQAGENAGAYSIGQGTLAASGNYQIGTFTPSIFTIDKASLTVVAPSISRLYGDQNPVLDWRNAVISGLKNGETGNVLDEFTLTIAPGATPRANAGSKFAINLAAFNDNNYVLSGFTAGELLIQKAPLVIAPVSLSVVQGVPVPSLNVTYSGLRNGETASVISGLQISTDAKDLSPVGEYLIRAYGASAANYDISYLPAIYTVAPNTVALPSTIEQALIQKQISGIAYSIPDKLAPVAMADAAPSVHSASEPEMGGRAESIDRHEGLNMDWFVRYTQELKRLLELH
jgi:filamentous hemagglutinin family protein